MLMWAHKSIKISYVTIIDVDEDNYPFSIFELYVVVSFFLGVNLFGIVDCREG